MTTIAIISDTHDRLPWNLTEVIGRADVIFHAGDIGSQKVLDALHATAPVVYAVLGNTDEDPSVFTEDIPQAQLVEIDGVEFAIAHKPIDARETGKHTRLDRESVIINGHTHIPMISWETDDVVRVCPGALADPRENYPRTVAFIEVSRGHIEDVRIESLSGKVVL